MYSQLSELPSQVKASMNEAQQAQWMAKYNEIFTATDDNKIAYTEAFCALALTQELRTFEGWCSVDVVDRQGDKVAPEALATALEPFIYTYGGNFNDSHSNRNVGCIYKFEVKEHSEGILGVYVFGIIYLGQEIFDLVWSEIQSGAKPAMSVGIYVTDARPKCDTKQCWMDIKALEIFEISTVVRPACKEALQEEVNMKAKSDVINSCPYCQVVYPILKDKVAEAEDLTILIAKGMRNMADEKLPEAPVEVAEKCEAPAEAPKEEAKVEEAPALPEPVIEKSEPIVVKADEIGALTQVLQNMMVLLQDIHKVALAPKPEAEPAVEESAPAAQAEPESNADDVADKEVPAEAEKPAEEAPEAEEEKPEAEEPSEDEKKALKQKADVDAHKALRYKAMAEGVKTLVPEAVVPIQAETSVLTILQDKKKLATLSF